MLFPYFIVRYFKKVPVFTGRSVASFRFISLAQVKSSEFYIAKSQQKLSHTCKICIVETSTTRWSCLFAVIAYMWLTNSFINSELHKASLDLILPVFSGEHSWLLSEPDLGVEISSSHSGCQTHRTLLQSALPGQCVCFLSDEIVILPLVMSMKKLAIFSGDYLFIFRPCPRMVRRLWQELEMRLFASGTYSVKQDQLRWESTFWEQHSVITCLLISAK